MIGLSISECFAAMATAEKGINPAVVEKVIAHTAASTPDDWEWIIQCNRAKRWSRSGRPMVAEELFRRFLAEGRIEQPRLAGKHIPNIDRSGIWVGSESEIVWK